MTAVQGDAGFFKAYQFRSPVAAKLQQPIFHEILTSVKQHCWLLSVLTFSFGFILFFSILFPSISFFLTETLQVGTLVAYANNFIII